MCVCKESAVLNKVDNFCTDIVATGCLYITFCVYIKFSKKGQNYTPVLFKLQKFIGVIICFVL